MLEFKSKRSIFLDLENTEIYIDENHKNIYYFMATILSSEYEIRVPALSSLEEVLAHAGECDNDAILEINGTKITPIYKWSSENNSWQLVQ